MNNKPTSSSGKPGLDLGRSARTFLTVALVLAGAWLLTREPSAEQVARSRLAIERAEALQPWNTALGIALRVIAITLSVVLVLGLAAALRVGIGILADRRKVLHPDSETGLFPARRVRPGETWQDLNRSPDGKVQTAALGGKSGLFFSLLARWLLGRDVPKVTEHPAVTILPHDVSPEQMQITAQAQAGQLMAAASRGGRGDLAQQAQNLLTMRPTRRGLPPMLTQGGTPQEIQLLLEAGMRDWDQQQDSPDAEYDVEALP